MKRATSDQLGEVRTFNATSGGIAWTLGSISLTDTAFKVTGGTCGLAPLEVRTSCTYDVSYAPTANTASSGTLGLTDSVGNTTSIALTGSGIAVPPVSPPPAPAAPTIRSISPASGSTTGGTTVTITGTNLVNVTAIKFGARAGTAISCPRATKCTVTSPRGTGSADIRVTTPSGTSLPVSADKFSWR